MLWRIKCVIQKIVSKGKRTILNAQERRGNLVLPLALSIIPLHWGLRYLG